MNLNAINQLAQRQGRAPWSLSFSFGRSLQAGGVGWGGVGWVPCSSVWFVLRLADQLHGSAFGRTPWRAAHFAN